MKMITEAQYATILADRKVYAGDQPISNGQLSLSKVAGKDLCHHVRQFLGYHMIKDFDVLNFLEDSGALILLLQQPYNMHSAHFVAQEMI